MKRQTFVRTAGIGFAATTATILAVGLSTPAMALDVGLGNVAKVKVAEPGSSLVDVQAPAARTKATVDTSNGVKANVKIGDNTSVDVGSNSGGTNVDVGAGRTSVKVGTGGGGGTTVDVGTGGGTGAKVTIGGGGQPSTGGGGGGGGKMPAKPGKKPVKVPGGGGVNLGGGGGNDTLGEDSGTSTGRSGGAVKAATGTKAAGGTSTKAVTGKGKATAVKGAAATDLTGTTTVAADGDALVPAGGHSTGFWLFWLLVAAVAGGLGTFGGVVLRRRHREAMLRRRMEALAAELDLDDEEEGTAPEAKDDDKSTLVSS
jgi:hypothetical protein